MSESTATESVSAEKIQEELKQEIAQVKVFDWEVLTPDNGIKKQLIKEGTGNCPNEDQVLEVIFSAKILDGAEFEKKKNKENANTIKIDNPEEDEPKFWNIAAKSMKVGEIARFIIQPEYGYGVKGLEKKVPSNACLSYEVEALEIKDKTKWQYTKEVRVKKALAFKDTGNKQFKAGQFADALKQYADALEWIEYGNEYDEFRIQCWGNQAAVNLKLQNNSEVLDNVKNVLEKQPNNAKALYRKGQAFFNMAKYDEARDAFTAVLAVEPNNQAAKDELATIDKKIKQNAAKDKKMYQNIFAHHFYEDTEVLYHHKDNPIVFLDIQIGNKEEQRIEIELFKHLVPKTTENFLKLCSGADQKFKNSIFHRLIKNFMLQGGDFNKQNGTGGISIYGEKFEDENFKAKHVERGLLSMANSGPNTNGSQFFITFVPTPHLDGKHVVFGKIVKNINYLNDLENVPTEADDRPKETIKIIDCGEVAKKIEEPAHHHKCDSCSSSDDEATKTVKKEDEAPQPKKEEEIPQKKD